MEKLNPRETAVLSTDNNQSFCNGALNEFYAQGWEKAAQWTKKVIEILRPLWVTTVNIMEQHPEWHIGWASSYKNKNPFDFVSLEEIKDWTDLENWLSEKARFTVDELKAYLIMKWWKDQLWPDHSKAWSQWAKLMPPLVDNDFDLITVKWDKVNSEAYSWFDWTDLDQKLRSRGIKNNLVTGVVTEVCVNATAMDSKKLWYNTYVVEDAIVPITKEGHIATLESLKSNWVIILTTNELRQLFL